MNMSQGAVLYDVHSAKAQKGVNSMEKGFKERQDCNGGLEAKQELLRGPRSLVIT